MYVYCFIANDIFRFPKVILYYPSPAFLLGGGVDWIHLAQDRVQWLTCEHNKKETVGSIKAGIID
jgi:hypothetical protein